MNEPTVARRAPPINRRAVLGTGLELGLLLALVVLGVAAHRQPLGIDVRLAGELRAWDAGPIGAVARGLGLVVSAPIWDSLILIIAGGLWHRHQHRAALLLASSLSVEAGTALTKLLVDRARPPGNDVLDLVQSGSFPSGHVARAVVTLGLLVAIVAWHRPRWRMPLLVGSLAVLIVLGLARIISGAHWPSDIVGAYVLGGLWLELFLVGWRRWVGVRPPP